MNNKEKAAKYDQIKADGEDFIAHINKIEASFQAYPLMNIFVGKVLTIMGQWQDENPAPGYDEETSDDSGLCTGLVDEGPDSMQRTCNKLAGHVGEHSPDE